MALSANTPIFRGYLADVDVRWNVISASVDDRTPEERGLEVTQKKWTRERVFLIHVYQPLDKSRFVINKSRYDSIDSYLSNDATYKPKYDDLDLVYDKEIYQKLRDNDVDDKLSKHVAHLFIRDPLVIFKELLNVDDSESSDHFEVNSNKWIPFLLVLNVLCRIFNLPTGKQ